MKLRKEWIPVWLKDPHDWREGTKMPTFRLDDDEIRAIAAFIWQSGVQGTLAAAEAGRSRKGQGSLRNPRLHGLPLHGRRRPEAGRHVRRQPEPRRRKGQLRLPGPLGAQSAPAHRALLPVRKDATSPRTTTSKHGLPFVFDLDHDKCPNDGHELQVQQMTPMPSLRLTEDEARDIASYLMTRKHANATYADADYMDDPEPEEQGPRPGAQSTAAPAATKSPAWKRSSASAPS